MIQSFILKLSQRIQLHSSDSTASALQQNEDANHFHKTFPFFIWLLRDVVLALPKDCHNIKEYFLTRVKGELFTNSVLIQLKRLHKKTLSHH